MANDSWALKDIPEVQIRLKKRINRIVSMAGPLLLLPLLTNRAGYDRRLQLLPGVHPRLQNHHFSIEES